MTESDVIHFTDTTAGAFSGTLGVAVDGYEWVEGLQVDVSLGTKGDYGDRMKEDAGPWLVAPGSWNGEPHLVMRKSAFAKRNLHRLFAAVRLSPDRIERFAAEYGLLGRSAPLFDPAKEVQSPRIGESFQLWRREITKMAGLLRLWDAVRNGDEDALRPFVLWQREPRQVVVSFAWSRSELRQDLVRDHQRAPSIQATHELLRRAVAKDRDGYIELKVDRLASDLYGATSSEVLDRWEFGDTIAPLQYYVFREVNRALDGHVKPAVLPFRNNDLYFFVDSLLTALYALFALELTGKIGAPILCAGCQSYFVPDHGAQKYCEDRCRKRHWYHENKGKAAGGTNGKAR